MQGQRIQSLVPMRSPGPALEPMARSERLPETFGFREALWLCSYSLAKGCSDLLQFARRVEKVRTSVRYNI